jgi:hypothetical protein
VRKAGLMAAMGNNAAFQKIKATETGIIKTDLTEIECQSYNPKIIIILIKVKGRYSLEEISTLTI